MDIERIRENFDCILEALDELKMIAPEGKDFYYYDCLIRDSIYLRNLIEAAMKEDCK